MVESADQAKQSAEELAKSEDRAKELVPETEDAETVGEFPGVELLKDSDLDTDDPIRAAAQADEARAQGRLTAPDPIYVPNPDLLSEEELRDEALVSGRAQDTEERVKDVPKPILRPQDYLGATEPEDVEAGADTAATQTVKDQPAKKRTSNR